MIKAGPRAGLFVFRRNRAVFARSRFRANACLAWIAARAEKARPRNGQATAEQKIEASARLNRKAICSSDCPVWLLHRLFGQAGPLLTNTSLGLHRDSRAFAADVALRYLVVLIACDEDQRAAMWTWSKVMKRILPTTAGLAALWMAQRSRPISRLPRFTPRRLPRSRSRLCLVGRDSILV